MTKFYKPERGVVTTSPKAPKKWKRLIGDKSVPNRDWSGAVGQAMRQLPKGAKKALEEAEEAKKISEFAKGKAIRPISKKKKQ